jgi:hypothetical protein
MTETLPHQINLAALQMANDLNADHADCKQWILLFVGAEDEAQLYNLELSDPGSAKTKGVRHVLRNGRNVTVIDLMEALTSLAGLVVIKQNIDGLLSAIAGGLFLIRTVQKATTIELSTEDASVVWALYQLDGSAKKEDLLNAWSDVVSGSQIVDAMVTPQKLEAHLAHLKDLGCVKEIGRHVLFAEPVELED